MIVCIYLLIMIIFLIACIIELCNTVKRQKELQEELNNKNCEHWDEFNELPNKFNTIALKCVIIALLSQLARFI